MIHLNCTHTVGKNQVVRLSIKLQSHEIKYYNDLVREENNT